MTGPGRQPEVVTDMSAGTNQPDERTEVPIVDLLRRFSVETDRFVERCSRSRGLHRTDLDALAVIMDASRNGVPLTPGGLAAALSLSPSATSALLDRLGGAGHVRRHRSDTDRRRVALEMSEGAEALGRELFTPLARRVGAVIDGLDDDERRLIARFLAEVIEATVRARTET